MSPNKPKLLAGKSLWEVLLGLFCIALTLCAYVVVAWDEASLISSQIKRRDPAGAAQVVALSAIILGFSYAIAVYHVTRLAYYRHLLRNYVSAAPKPLNLRECPAITILIPSYCEEIGVIWQTLMSAALLDYPNKYIVLLLDNPPAAQAVDEQRLLAESRLQPGLLLALFTYIRRRLSEGTDELQSSLLVRGADLRYLQDSASKLYVDAAEFLEKTAKDVLDGKLGGGQTAAHVRRFFVDNILLEPAHALRGRAAELLHQSAELAVIQDEIERLSTLFQFDVDIFERKRYANLTHAPNKASNLNAYLGLMGRKFRVDTSRGGIWLLPSDNEKDATFSPRAAEYIVILDADSLMHRDYLNKTVALMLAPGNGNIAVAQTPYKAIPGSPSLLERTAGASTDAHFCVAQGMSLLHAGWWVGATALLRMAALADIAEKGSERELDFSVFIPDKTLIEDADATIRLALHGWQVHHLAEHLNWSATPSDFGALVIQRRRWANGGLIIMPTLMQRLKAAPRTFTVLVEAFLRIYHLLAAPITAIGGLAILIYPFDVRFASTWVGLAILPYLYLHGRELKRTGYEWFDLFRIFAMNIVLLPVVMGGVLKSLEQIVRGRKLPFARTPKVAYRTATPALYLLAPLALAAWSVRCFYQAVMLDLRGQAFPSLICSLALVYACLLFIGVRPIIIDLAAAASERLSHAADLAVGLFRAFVSKPLIQSEAPPKSVVADRPKRDGE
jgi:cellulose synthase/poly-beta-1,6-N-acetylglucosamine synthase-like glycosyltransferase